MAVSGFSLPSMHHNLEWIGELDIEYDASTFDTDPFEPQSNPAKHNLALLGRESLHRKRICGTSLLTSTGL